MEARLNCAQSAQLLMARHAWFLACGHCQPNNICDVCAHERGSEAISMSFELSQWWSSDNVSCLFGGWEEESSGVGKWEWRNDKWQATQITLSWFGRIGGPRLDGLLCQAPSPRRFHCLFCLSKRETKSLNMFRKFFDTLWNTITLRNVRPVLQTRTGDCTHSIYGCV